MVDTDVLIWYLRGSSKAAGALDGIEKFSISSVVYMELLQGVRNKTELNALKHFIKNKEIETMPITPEITSRATYFMEQYSLGNGLRLADALIAGTVDIYAETLLTANVSHYRVISSLSLKKFNPH